MEKTSAIIYLNEQRGLIEKSDSNCFCTFNYDGYYNEAKQAFGSIFLFNELILNSSARLATVIEHNCYFILIPITGSLNYQTSDQPSQVLEVGEIIICPCQKGSLFQTCNPYSYENIHLIQIGIKADSHSGQQEKFPFNLTSFPDELNEVLVVESKFKLSAGRFGGRKEFIYPLKGGSSHFIFALSGAFEVSGRLIHPGDSLILWNSNETEIEALSNDAVLISIETEAALSGAE